MSNPNHGGHRPGSGRKLGTKWASTLAKETVRELVRQEITAELESMIHAQIAQAKGLHYLVVRDADGRFTRIPDTIEPEAFDALLASDSVIEVWTKGPSTSAFTDLMNRAIDRPKEQEQTLNVVGEHTLAILDRWKEENRRRQEAEEAEKKPH